MAKKPNPPKSLKLSRSGAAIKATWKLAAEANKSKNDQAWTYEDMEWYFNSNYYKYKVKTVKNAKGKKVKQKYLPWVQSRSKANKKENGGKGRNVTGDRIWVRDLGTKTTAFSQKYNRKNYHPFVYKKKSDRYLKTVTVHIWSGNSAGRSKTISATYTFKTPPTPSISAINYDQESSKLSATISVDKDAIKGAKERYDTQYRVVRTDNIKGSKYNNNTRTIYSTTDKKGKEILTEWKSTQDVDYAWNVDMESVRRLNPGQWVEVTVRAYSRGIRGRSEGTAARTRLFCYPPKPTISAVDVSDDQVIIKIKTNEDPGNHKILDKVELFILRDTLIRTEELAATTGDWEKVDGAVGDHNCVGFVQPLHDASVSDNRHFTYYRIVSYHDQYTSDSNVFKAKNIKAVDNPVWDDSLVIYDVSPGTDSESLVVKMAWQEDDSTGTEVSWSEFEDAWESNIDPSIKDVDWFDMDEEGVPKPQIAENFGDPGYVQENDPYYNQVLYDYVTNSIEGNSWAEKIGKLYTSKLSIRKLAEATKYYVKARRFSDVDGEKTYSKIVVTAPGSQYPIAPYALPTSVTVSSSAYSRRGDDYEIRWVTEGDSVQKSWDLYQIVMVDKEVDGEIVQVEQFLVEKHGDDSSGATVISANRMIELIEGSEDNSVTFMLGVSTSEANSALQTRSESFKVIVQDPPTLDVAVASVLTEKPLRLFVKTDEPSVNLVYKVISKGITTNDVYGNIDYQVEDDVVYSDYTTPDWLGAEDGSYYAIVTAEDEDTAYYDTCDYYVQANVVSEVTDMSSEQVERNFTVLWDHQAVAPGDDTLIAVDVDARSVTMTPTKPEGWVESDLLDIYRSSNGQMTMIGSGIQFGSVITDRFAPFSKRADLFYRLATRTDDGDVDFIDVYYDLPLSFLRFDWGEGESRDFLELPYNNDVTIKYTKDFESKAYSDGQISGRWNKAVAETATLKADILRLSDYEQHRKLIALAEFPGAVFVRLPDGGAFTANVEVSNISDKYKTLINNISLNATRIRSQDVFEIQPSDAVLQDGIVPMGEPTTSTVVRVLSWINRPPAQGDIHVLADFPIDNQVSLTLRDSNDGYTASWEIQNEEADRTIRIGEIQQELAEYLASDAITSDTKFLLTAKYEIDRYATVPAETITEQAEENASPSENGWYEYDSEADAIVPTSDETIEEGKEYYDSTETAPYDDYVYVPVTFAEPDDDPMGNGWYELVDGEYILTEDEELVPGKTYYVMTE